MRLKAVLTVVIFSLAAVIAKSQSITLKGKLSEKSDNSPIAGATVRLVSQRDSTQIKQIITDKMGNFAFNNLNASSYMFRISYRAPNS